MFTPQSSMTMKICVRLYFYSLHILDQPDELGYSRMVHLGEDENFFFNKCLFFRFGILDFSFVDDFDCDRQFEPLVVSFVHFSEGALAKTVSEFELSTDVLSVESISPEDSRSVVF